MSPAPFAPLTPVGRFTLRFAAVAAALLALCESARGTRPFSAFVADGLTAPAAALLRVLSGERVDAVGASLVSASAQLNVVRGCDGLEAVVLYAAAVLAWPGTLRRRVGALAIGLVVIHVSNLLRLIASWLVVRHAPEAFPELHGVVAPLALVLVATAVFLVHVSRDPHVDAAHVHDVPRTGA